MEDHVSDPSISMRSRRHVGDSVFRSQLRHLLATLGGSYVIEFLWDVIKCYEHIVIQNFKPTAGGNSDKVLPMTSSNGVDHESKVCGPNTSSICVSSELRRGIY